MSLEIAQNIFFIPGRRKGGYPFCNSLFIADERSAIIDPASNRSELALYKDARIALLSHFHNDHIRDLKLFPDAQIAIHQLESKALRDEKVVIDLIFFADEPQEEKDSWMARKAREMKTEWGWQASFSFQDNDEINLGKTRVKIIHTPGHTIGHSCFWLPVEEILFSADIDLTDFGPWYGNACSDAEVFWCSLEKLKKIKPRLVVTGHEMGLVKGEDFPGLLDKFQNVIVHREERILDALKEPKTLEELVSLGIIYGEFLQKASGLRPPEQRMLIHHLRWLVKKGLVAQEYGKWFRLAP